MRGTPFPLPLAISSLARSLPRRSLIAPFARHKLLTGCVPPNRLGYMYCFSFFNMQATNYVLAHQEEDSAGEIETKLIKVSQKLFILLLHLIVSIM